MLLKFQILFDWCQSECVLSLSWCFWFFSLFLCFSARYLLFVFSDLFLTPSPLLSATNAWSISNYFLGLLCVLVPSWFCPLGKSSRGMVGMRTTKLGCLLPCISSWGVDYAWLSPSMLLSVQLSLSNYCMCLYHLSTFLLCQLPLTSAFLRVSWTPLAPF